MRICVVKLAIRIEMERIGYNYCQILSLITYVTCKYIFGILDFLRFNSEYVSFLFFHWLFFPLSSSSSSSSSGFFPNSKFGQLNYASFAKKKFLCPIWNVELARYLRCRLFSRWPVYDSAIIICAHLSNLYCVLTITTMPCLSPLTRNKTICTTTIMILCGHTHSHTHRNYPEYFQRYCVASHIILFFLDVFCRCLSLCLPVFCCFDVLICLSYFSSLCCLIFYCIWKNTIKQFMGMLKMWVLVSNSNALEAILVALLLPLLFTDNTNFYFTTL